MKPEFLLCCIEVFQNSRDGDLNLYRHIVPHHVRNVTPDITVSRSGTVRFRDDFRTQENKNLLLKCF